MLNFPALPISKPLSTSSRADETDVILTKHALSRTGHLDAAKHGLSPFPDAPLFAAIKQFQSANGLYIDGIMRPGGETASALGQQFGNELFTDISKKKPVQEGDKENCEYQLYKVDMPTCRAISRRRGPRAAALCIAAAMARYGACLAGHPIPPLNTWND
ncbi:MAG: hypothetical protein AB7N54_14305 [Alphaproteobacteria bacterium]